MQKFKLSKELYEISGLEKFNDSILIAINDGGNHPLIFFIDLRGNILKKTVLKDAVNRDWEDLTMDDKRNLYIADVGNNLGSYKEFNVLKLNIDKAFISDTVDFEQLRFKYNLDPNEITPDCEAVYWFEDSLHLITKNNKKLPRKAARNINSSLRFPEHYVISDSGDKQTAFKAKQNTPYMHKVRNRGIKDLVTAIDLKDGVFSVLTYGQLRTFAIRKSDQEVVFSEAWGNLKFKRLSQKEAVVILDKKKIVIASEGHPLLGGPCIYVIELK